ncbi:MAG TPA: zinc ABC transporter substrate-binding protein [Stellaceae bacterium]|nr:zinc ABC transporter substrate-binding protein [Stellaceae bacterium]
MSRILPWLALAGALLTGAAARAAGDAPPAVAVTIKPLHSLVAGVMEGIGKPDLVISGTSRPTDYVPAAGEAERLVKARLVFWVGPMLERNLARPLASIAGATEVVAVSTGPGVILRPTRSGGVWALDDDAPAGTSDVPMVDGHLWLDPRNARAMVALAASRLGAADPAHAARYTANAAKLYARLDALDATLQHMLMAVVSWRFLVYRDDYQYLEQRYRLSAAGAVLGASGQPPGPLRMEAIRHQLQLSHARCVFGEPDSPEALVDAVTDGLDVRTGSLDPEGIALKPGPDLYFDLMNALAGSLQKCLLGSH